MSERTVQDEITFVRRCLDMLDAELTRIDEGRKPVMSASGLLRPVLNAKEALARMEMVMKNEHVGKTDMSGDEATMREALKAVLRCISLIKSRTVTMDGKHNIINYEKQIKSALSAPVRNCNALSADDVKSRFKKRMASSDMGLIGENIVEVVNGVVDFLYSTEKGGEE